MKFRWTVAPAQPLLAGQLANQLRISPLLAQCLLNRGLSEPASMSGFLEPRLKDLSDPFLLPNMATAVERLLLARERKEQIVIFGDYDVDGVTSTALLIEVLRRLGWGVAGYLPHRIDEGYGLTPEAVENCLAKCPATLLLAVDCGSTSRETIAVLKTRGIDTIVLDHHQISDPPPAAVALINPRVGRQGGGQAGGEKFPFAELCSVGLAFKLAHALVKRGRESGLPEAAGLDLRPFLDLVALGTIADIVPLTGENRILVSAGLERLRSTRRPGLVALKQVAQCPPVLSTHDVGFQLAPRLNAAGRLETAEKALHLVMAASLVEALPLARELDAFNRERQRIEKAIIAEALSLVRARFKPETDYVIVEGQLPWHIGVVGIVAARLLQQFYRPTIIVGGEGAEWRGSGRSIAGFDLAAALRECGDLLVRHGGHAQAAGLTIIPDRLDDFRVRLNEVARREIPPDRLQPELRLDAEVGLEEINFECLGSLGRLRPLGQGNPATQFFARNLTHHRPLQRIGADRQHVKMWVGDGATSHEAVWWGAGAENLPVGRFDLAFAPTINDYNGRTTIQLKVLDWRPSSDRAVRG